MDIFLTGKRAKKKPRWLEGLLLKSPAMDITLTLPDDWHLHLRDDAVMASVLPHTAAQFGRALIMPNLRPPVTTVDQALAYRQRILAARSVGSTFNPLMTLYLTDHTAIAEIEKAAAHASIVAAKLYPAGATTHSDAGVTHIERIYPLLEMMARCGLPLCVHGEVTDPSVDVFDREKYFVDDVLVPLTRRLPELRVVFEHITTAEAVAFVQAGKASHLAATLTPQHLLYDRNAIFQGGIRPHMYCLPVLKRAHHREALLRAATSGDSRFFLGTDSAPHAKQTKETACGCAGIYSAPLAIELYAEAFASVNRLDQLEAFAAFYGADFYGLPRNTGTITLSNKPWTVPSGYALGDDQVVPIRAGENMDWQLSCRRA